MSTYLQSAVGSRLFEHNDSTSSLSEHMSAIYETLPDVPEHIVYSSPDDLVSQIAPASGSGTLSSCEESTRISGPQPLRNNTNRIKRNRSRSPSVCSALSQTDVAGSGSSSGSFLTWPSSSSSFVPLRRCRSRASVIDPSSAVPAPSSSSVSPTPVIALTLVVPPQTTPATLSPFPSSPRSLSHLRLPSDASAASASTTTTATSSSTFASKSTAPSSTSVSTTCAPTYTYPSCLKQSHSRLGAKPTATAAVMAHAMVGKTMRRSASISTKNSTAKSVRFAEIPIVHTDVVWASESESSDDEDDNEGRKVSGILMRAGEEEEEEEEEGMEAVFGMHEGEEVEIQEIVEEPLEMERVEGQQVEEITEHGEEDEDDGADHDRVTDANTHANARRSKPSTSLTQTARTVKKWLLRTVTKPVSSSLSSLSSSSSSSSAPRRPTISGPLPLSGSSAPVAVGAVEKRASDTASLRSRSSSVASTSSRVSLPSSPRPLTIPASRTRLTLNLSIPGPYPLSAPSIYAHAHARTRLESDVSLASTSASVPSSALALSPRSPRPRRRGASFATGKSPVSPTPTPMSPTRLGTVPMVRSGSRNRCMASFGPSSPQEAVAKVVVGDAGP